MNERGFMFPVTLCVLLLLLTFLSIHYNQYISEKRYLLECKDFERNQSYFLQSLKKVEKALIEGEILTEGIHYYEEGVVTYSVREAEQPKLRVTLYLTTERQERLMGFGYFNTEAQRIVKWTERN